jgi:hypothetical protein
MRIWGAGLAIVPNRGSEPDVIIAGEKNLLFFNGTILSTIREAEHLPNRIRHLITDTKKLS